MKLVIHKGALKKDTEVYYRPNLWEEINMDLLIKGIELIADKFLGHKDYRVVYQGIAIHIIKYLLKKYESDLKKEDLIRIVEALNGLKKSN